MPRNRVTVDYDGIGEVLRSREMEQDLLRRAERVAAAVRAAGVMVSGVPGTDELPVKVKSNIGRNRASARVSIPHPAALAVEAKHRLLGRALDAAG